MMVNNDEIRFNVCLLHHSPLFSCCSLPTMTPTTAFLPLLLVLYLLSHTISVSFASDSITTNQSLFGNQKIISKGGKFMLGFFTKVNSSSKFYIGIWYNKISVFTPVWVANRATPVSDPNRCVFQIFKDGNLVLFNEANSLIWSTNTTSTSNSSTVAVLQDDGNLVLRDGHNSTEVFWQTFENPTDTLLPGGKIAFNKLTGVKQRLIAWKNTEDPTPGSYSYEMDPQGANQYVMQWNRSKTYWNTGLWDGRMFTRIPEMNGMSSNHDYNLTYVETDKEKYVAYFVQGSDIISRVILNANGQLKMLTWVEITQEWTQFWFEPKAQFTALCGPFGSCNEQRLSYCSCIKGFSEKSPEDWDLNDHSGGCFRNTNLQCDANNNSTSVGEQDKFLEMSSVRLPDNGKPFQAESVDACELTCLNNCSCTAYSYGSNCTLWHGDLLNLQDQYTGSDGGTLYIRLAASEFPSHHKKGKVLWIVAGGVAAFLFCLVLVFMLVVWTRRRRKLMASASEVVMGGLTIFKYSELQRLTKNFSDKLGAGGFGTVFKGALPDSTAVAVKRLEGLRQGEKQFRAEVSTLGTIQHVNLVSLRGFCAEDTKRLLVFEYMPNGSLDSHLFHNNDNVLDWSTRYRIGLGIARGLAYLHEKCRECIIHCDIKPENILLDAEFNPKVADFGLAKLLGREFSHVLTSMRGTIGYLAPEWITGLAITPKADVYSFGMMLLEIISGKRNTKQLAESGDYYFPVEAAMKVRQDMVHCLLDERLNGEANMEEVDRACRVACWCIQDLESQRPTMGLVVQMLEGLLEVTVPPISRILQDLVIDSHGAGQDSELSA
ncbi:S-receptor-like serine/threonine-protein kinase protein [Dioscorea alata]|uniref:S-receptor-like serine/threonine-protein kinase protein n=1 Tax=Dioscorea alata TaxID=55571 RepID=A0ACB7UPD5_DIOAL|nr:S-receptor-like serine/threonine-protein kinase protein [Dioscorea alata]